MASRDFIDQIHTVPLISPVAAFTGNTAIVSNIIDTAGYEGVLLSLNIGTAGTGATVTITMEHGDNSGLSDTSAPAAQDLVGTAALAGFVSANTNVTRKLGYVGSKRYIRLTATPATNSGNIFLSGVALLGYGRNNPQANPPQ